MCLIATFFGSTLQALLNRCCGVLHVDVAHVRMPHWIVACLVIFSCRFLEIAPAPFPFHFQTSKSKGIKMDPKEACAELASRSTVLKMRLSQNGDTIHRDIP